MHFPHITSRQNVNNPNPDSNVQTETANIPTGVQAAVVTFGFVLMAFSFLYFLRRSRNQSKRARLMRGVANSENASLPRQPMPVMHMRPDSSNVVHVPLRNPPAAPTHTHAAKRPTTPRFNPDNLVSFDVPEKDRDQPCAICLEALETEPVSAGPCLHTMHTSCLGGWLMKDPKSACPVCRASFVDGAQTSSGVSSGSSLAARIGGWNGASNAQVSAM